MTHHSVITSSYTSKILKIDKFGDFSCDIDYSSRTGVFRDVVSLIVNQCDPRLPQGASGGHIVSASLAKPACRDIIIQMFKTNKFIMKSDRRKLSMNKYSLFTLTHIKEYTYLSR